MDRSISAYNDNERVQRYDRDMDLMHPNRHKMVEVALEVLPFEPTAQLMALDLGIGTGFFTWRFLQQYPNATVIGVDGSEAMIRLANRRLQDFQGQIQLTTNPFEDVDSAILGKEKFDVAFSSHALHHLDAETKRKVLSVVVNHLADRGWFLNADLVAGQHPEIEEIIQQIRISGIESRNKNRDPRFRDAERIRVFLAELERTEADQPITVGEDVSLLRECGIVNATVFWQEYREVVYGGFKANA